MTNPTQDSPSQPSLRQRLLRPIVVIPVVLVAAAALVVGLALFQPWKLFVDEQVDEAFPAADSIASSAPAAPTAESDATTQPSGESPAAATEPVLLSSGSFISHEHATTGTAEIYQLPDGSRVLRIENLDTSNGPDLKVWLTDAPVIEGVDGWGVFDDGQYLDLGRLKGNQGSQNYTIPADADISQLTSLSIWCDRFDVSFGAVQLLPA